MWDLINKAPAAPYPPLIPPRLNSVVYKGFTPSFYFGYQAADRLCASHRYLGARRDGLTGEDGRPAARLFEKFAATARWVFTNDGAHSRVFRTAIVVIPNECYEADVENGGAAAYRLKTELERRHAEEFKGSILDEERGVVYIIAPHDGPPDEIRCYWGPAVFGATDQSRRKGRLTAVFIQSDGREIQLDEPSHPYLRKVDGQDDLIPDSLPVGVYEGQRILLIGGALGDAAIVLSRWFSGGSDGWAFIDLEARGDAARGRGDGAVVAPKGTVEDDPITGARSWTFSAAHGGDRPGDQPEKIRITYTPTDPASPTVTPDDKWNKFDKNKSFIPLKVDSFPEECAIKEKSPIKIESPPERDATERGTIVILPRVPASAADDEEIAFDLAVVGLALQRIDGANALPGLEDWRMLFDAEGRLIEKRNLDCLSLGARAGTANLFFAAPGCNWEPVRMSGGVNLPLADGGAVTLHSPPTPLTDRIHAILRLRKPLSIFLRSDRDLTFGRGSPTPDRITLGLLEIPGSLGLADDNGATLEQVGLSRRHLKIHLDAARASLRVAMLDGRAPAWIIGDDGALRETLRPGHDDAAELTPGEGLLVGNYLMAFNTKKLGGK